MNSSNPFVEQHLAYLLPLFMIVSLAFLGIIMVPLWRICKKAGLSPWLSLIIFLPLGPLILLYVLAFIHWRVVPAPQLGAGYAPYPQPVTYPVAPYTPGAPPAEPRPPYRPS